MTAVDKSNSKFRIKPTAAGRENYNGVFPLFREVRLILLNKVISDFHGPKKVFSSHSVKNIDV